MKRKIIKIDENKCNGCGLCIPNCYEGALQIIDGKVRLISDLFCDGLGNCIGHCPTNALTIEEREAEPYDEIKVMEKMIPIGINTIKAHLEHLKDHEENEYLQEAINYLNEKGIKNPIEENEENKMNFSGCPGSKIMDFRGKKKSSSGNAERQESELQQWPIQLNLVPVNAPYFKDGDLVVAADCVPFAYPNFHADFLKDKSVVIGCPKLDDIDFYIEKLTEILKVNNIKNVTLVNMEVPCCFGLQDTLEKAISQSGKVIPFRQSIITIQGSKK